MKCFQNLVPPFVWLAAVALACENLPVCRAGGDEGLSGLPGRNDPGPDPDTGCATFVGGPQHQEPTVAAPAEPGGAPAPGLALVVSADSVEQSGSNLILGQYLVEPAEDGVVVAPVDTGMAVRGHFVMEGAALAGGTVALQSSSGRGLVVLWIGAREDAGQGVLESFQQVAATRVLALPAGGLDVRQLMALAEQYLGHDPRLAVGFAVLQRSSSGPEHALGAFTLGDGSHRIEFEIP